MTQRRFECRPPVYPVFVPPPDYTRGLAASLHFDFPHAWTAHILRSPPLIAPARAFTYPQKIAGEEDALARGALLLEVHPAAGGNFLATCALGFEGEGPLSGVWSCPAPHEMCAVAGGYAYLIDTRSPERCTHLAMRPVVEVRALPDHGLLVFSGFHQMAAWGADGMAWQTARISWEGIQISRVEGDTLHGMAWDMASDRDVPFTVDLRSGKHEGGSAPR